MGVKYIPVDGHGRALGEHAHNARLTDDDVELIRQLHEGGGLGYKAIADKFEVHKATVADICKYRRRATTPEAYRKILT